jgi:hypothetical protein
MRRKGMGVKQQRRRERHDVDEENAKEEGGYNDEEEGGGYNDNKERHARSRKVGDRYNDSKEELGHTMRNMSDPPIPRSLDTYNTLYYKYMIFTIIYLFSQERPSPMSPVGNGAQFGSTFPIGNSLVVI